MFKNPKAQMALVLLVGLLAGYAAASGKLNLFSKGDARSPEQSSATSPLSADEEKGKDERAGVLLAAHNSAVQQKTAATGKKPNILVLWGDDIGYWNVSAYNRGMMGYRTPNIDRLAKEGAIFTDCYAQQSCTAGRAAFITGQSPLRTGLLKVGLPGAKEGLSDKDPTLADLLTPLGYACAQFGKNHLGDRNEMLPTVHGFDEFFGNLYHLNAEEEPEHPDYPKNPEFKKRFGPRGVLKCQATDKDDETVDPRFGKVGKQTIDDTGPLTKKRMETIDDEITAAALDYIDRAHKAVKVFGDDLETLKAKAKEVEAVLKTTPGSEDVSTEQITGQLVLQVRVKQEELGRYGLTAKAVLDLVESIGSKPLGEVVEGQLRFPLVVRLPEKLRSDPEALKRLPIVAPTGERVPLAEVADVAVLNSPSTIAREWGQRRVVVTANVRGRDLGSFVGEARRRVNAEVTLPAGRYRFE